MIHSGIIFRAGATVDNVFFDKAIPDQKKIIFPESVKNECKNWCDLALFRQMDEI